MTGTIFEGMNLHDYFKQEWKKLEKEVLAIPNDRIVGLDADQSAAEMAAKYAVVCPVLGNDISYDEPPFNPDNRGGDIYVAVHVPYTGDKTMFRCHASHRPIITDPIAVHDGELVLQVRAQLSHLQELPNAVHRLIGRLNEGLGPIADHLKHLVPELTKQAASKFKERQAQLKSHASVLGTLQGFSLRKRTDSRESIIVPVKPKTIQVQPAQTLTKADPDPQLSLGDYDEILKIIQNMVTVFERSPSVFRTMEEEHLRTILLVALNGIFEGGATGETFNGAGKTDILIRVKNDNIFIAECLIWDGPEHFRKKLQDQLFQYSTWRDSKLAAIVFNRRKNFTDTVQKMRDVVAGLTTKVSDLPVAAPTGCRHRMRRADDVQKQFVLTCLAFDVPG